MELTSYILGKKAGGGSTPTGTINITENGITNVSNYASADVNVQPNLQSKEVSITSNGSSTISPDSSYDGLSSVSLTTNVQPNLETKSITITENTTTTVTPTTGKDGMSSVEITTNVSGGGGTHDWSAIGYNSEPSDIGDAYDYAVQIKNSWSSNITLNNRYENNYKLVYMPYVQFYNNNYQKNMDTMFKGCINLKQIPLLDTSNVTSMAKTFYGCDSLKQISLLNTSNVTDMTAMFYGCKSLTTIPLLNASNVTTMNERYNGMFQNCESLTSIANLNTQSLEGLGSYMFYGCKSLESIPQIDTSKITNVENMFGSCTSLKTIPLLDFSSVNSFVGDMFNSIYSLQNLGGFKDLGETYSITATANTPTLSLNLGNQNNLTYQSLINVIDNLYDIATRGCNTQKLRIGDTNLAKLTAEEIAIATNKGWTVA